MTRPRTAPCFIRPDEASAESDTRTGPTDNSLIKRSVMKNRLIWLLLSLLGMAAGCSSNDKLIPVEYGCPHADYEIKGRVTDPDGNPIRAIEITTDELPVAYSSATGDYRLKGTAFPGDMRIRFTDTDGPDNGGNFAERTVVVTFTGEDCIEPGDGRWYDGAFFKEVDVQLDPETEP